jgi:hypothetical protein
MKKITTRQLAALPATASTAANRLVARVIDGDSLRIVTGGGDEGRRAYARERSIII